MKTQSYGAWREMYFAPYAGHPSTFAIFLDDNLRQALNDYRENRENGSVGSSKDSPLSVFPSSGFEALDITETDGDTQSGRWPDKDGRYWYKLTLRDGRVENGFYYEGDKARGYPKKDAKGNDVWWFIIGHAEGTRITGFCQEPDYSEGFPRKDSHYYYNFKFYDTECLPIRQWMEEKDCNYLKRIKHENPALYQQEIADLNAKNPNHPAIAELMLETKKAEEEKRLAAQRAKQEAQAQARQRAEAEERERQRIEAEQKQSQEKAPKLSSSSSSSSASSGAALPIIPAKHVRLVCDAQGAPIELGRGGCGVVYKGDWNGAEAAVKQLLTDQVTEAVKATFQREAEVMITLRHPNIVQLYGIVDVNCILALEFMAEGSLYNLLHSEKPLNWRLNYCLGLDVARGLVYLHHKEVLHLDLKSLNVLLESQVETKDKAAYKAKLTDFGLAKTKEAHISHFSTLKGATERWKAPELLTATREQKVKPTPACDVYSFALLLWEIAARQIPYGNRNVVLEVGIQGYRESIPGHTPLIMAQVMRACWEPLPQKRLTMEAALSRLSAQPVMDTTPMPSAHQGEKPGSSSGYGSKPASPAGWVAMDAISLFKPPRPGAESAAGSSSSGSSHASLPPPPAEEDVLEAVVIKNYRAKRAGELTVIKGARMTILELENDDWWHCEYKGKRGLVPSCCLELAEPIVDENKGDIVSGFPSNLASQMG